ncbi:hypothetical protein [Neptuniibacter sp. QD48_11]|uniref:hypothetical protein n=1 Tax=Neptuniibacter sp. QD48_11 TaxID=3398211 RepID=UPI0039F57A05
MITFSIIKNLSAPEVEPQSDVRYLLRQVGRNQSLVLCYAVKRDFLSVPKTYSILEFSADEVLEVHQMSIEDYLDGFEEDMDIPQAGFYQFDTDDPEEASADDEDETDVLVLVISDSVFEVTYQTLKQHEDTYHCANAEQALIQYLTAEKLPS